MSRKKEVILTLTRRVLQDWDALTAEANMGFLLEEPAQAPEEALSRARLKTNKEMND